jgi:hypothetical protein
MSFPFDPQQGLIIVRAERRVQKSFSGVARAGPLFPVEHSPPKH